MLLDLVGQATGHVQPERSGVGGEDGQEAGLRAQDVRPPQHHVGQVLEAGGIGQFGGHRFAVIAQDNLVLNI